MISFLLLFAAPIIFAWLILRFAFGKKEEKHEK
jgi:hypothetical protein